MAKRAGFRTLWLSAFGSSNLPPRIGNLVLPLAYPNFRRRFLTNPFLLKAVGKAFTEKAFPPALLHRAAACKAAVIERAVSAGAFAPAGALCPL